MKNLLVTLCLFCATETFAQAVVWDNFDACAGNWKQSTLLGAKRSFKPAAFVNTPPLSQQGGCYLAYATADTFRAKDTIGWFAAQQVQTWKHRWLNMMVYSRDAGIKLTLDVADDADGDTLTVSDVDTLRSTTKMLIGGWQEINFDLWHDFTDINPSVGNNVWDSIVRSLTFRFVADTSYHLSDTIYLRVDEIQNSDTTGFSFLKAFPLTFTPDVLTGLTQNFSVYLQNMGTAPVSLANFAFTGPGAAHYSVLRAPAIVDISGRDSVLVRYAPTVKGPDTAQLSFTSNAIDNPSVTAYFNGLADTAQAQLDAFVIFPLASTAVGTTITDWAIIRNIGRVPVYMMGYDSIQGPGAKDYTTNGWFHGAILPGQTDSFQVAFTPSRGGNRPASIKLWYRKTMQTLDSVFVPCLGVGGTASINTTPLQINDSVTMGETRNYVISMTNYGSYGVRMTYQTMQGNDASMFTITRPLYAPLDPGYPDSVIVHFAPTSLGVKFAYVQLVTDAQNQPIVVVPITVVVGTRELSATPTSMFLSDTALVGSTISRSVLVQSVGTLPVRIDSVRLLNRDTTHSFSITRTPKSLLGIAESDTLGVNFSPITQGVKSDTIRLYTNSASVPSVDIVLRGFAGARRVFSSDTVLIDTVTIEQSYTQCFTLRDSGNLPIIISNIILGGTNSDQFLLVKPTLFPHTIPPGGVDTVCVKIHPTSQGDKTAQLLIQTDAQNGTNVYVTFKTYGTTVSVQDPLMQPFSSLISASPNPLRDATALTIALAPGERVTSLVVVDMLGREVRDMTGSVSASVILPMQNYPAGMYYVRLSTNARSMVLPLVVAR